MSAKIGIGVTTFNRPEVVAKTVKRIRKLTPGAKVVVVDDASEHPLPVSDYRFESTVGIAAAKNKCLELLMADSNVEHIFLFDDDTYPLVKNWWKPYVESQEPHLMYCFTHWGNGRPVGDSQVLYDDGTTVAYSHPRGCMLYVDRDAVERVGGMDFRFGRWGKEHVDWSNRIHAAGLTTFRYQDVKDSYDLIYSMDERDLKAGEHSTTVSLEERQAYRPGNQKLHDAQRDSPAFRHFSGPRNVVLTSYLTGVPDPQRGTMWETDVEPLRVLIESARDHADVVVLHNGLENPEMEGATFVKVDTGWSNPLPERWTQQYKWLRENRSQGFVFCVDATDVEFLRNPFPHLEPGTLYIGSEDKTVGDPWMRNKFPTLQTMFRMHGRSRLLNCGVVGGDWDTVMRLNQRMASVHADHPEIRFNMGPFNHIMYSGEFVYKTGVPIHTRFKAFEHKHPSAWVRHK